MASVPFCRCVSNLRNCPRLQARWWSSMRPLRSNAKRDHKIVHGQQTCTTQNTYYKINSLSFSTLQILRVPVKTRNSGSPVAAGTEKTDTPGTISKPKITLHDSDGRVAGVMTKEEAQRLARRKDLKLVLVQNPGTSQGNKEVYKLLTGAELHEERMKERRLKQEREPEERDSKTLILSSRISEHDIGTRIKAVKKWLKKKHSVCVTILSSRNDPSSKTQEEISETIASSIEGAGKIYQKRVKDNVMKFTIQPISTEDSSSTNQPSKTEESSSTNQPIKTEESSS